MKKATLHITLLLVAFIGLNYLSNSFNFRIDFTEDQRYTLSEPTKNMLKNIDSDVFVKVYLAGDELPGGFKRLEEAIKQTLDEFQSTTDNKINYRFIDIYTEIKDDGEREKLIAEIAQKGIIPTNIVAKKNGKNTQILILPGAIISYQSKELPIFLLKGNQLNTPQEKLNQAIEGVEFEIADAIKQLTQKEKKKIGFFVNYSSLPAIRQIDLIATLKKNYDLFPVDLSASPTLDGLDAIFVMNPDKPFSEEDKYKIDQFIVKGGKALFFIDPVKTEPIGEEGVFAKPFSVNLDDLFFKYGIRLNTNLLKDMQMSAAIPMNVGNIGESPTIQLVPWPYFPLINSFGNSTITHNLDAVYLKYPSTIDTVKSENIVKTPLLQSSVYTQILNTPATVSYHTAAKDFDAAKQKAGVKTIAYLLEGQFESYFSNLILPSDPRFTSFKSKDKSSKIIICADGDLPTNDVDEKAQQPLPLGFDKYSKHTFANKDFVKNAVDYLLEPDGIIASRSKTVKLRPLDKAEISQNMTKWQAINLLVPFGLLGILGLLFSFTIRRKYL
ncbi:MAG: gliding motility-associated ABC transporter substrate-binding protein GldG [Bacteroidota bacterium]